MYTKFALEIGLNENAGELWNRLSTIGAKLLVQTLDNISNGIIKRIPQEGEVVIAPKIEKELSKIASGGEMSRFMLAFKTILADIDQIDTLVFDEIDTGISGIAANVTGEKMKQISRKHQVICVTHLASIAAKGDYNYFVCKEIENEKTKTKVKQLSEDEILSEIARISTGTITEISLKHAKELRYMNMKEIA